MKTENRDIRFRIWDGVDYMSSSFNLMQLQNKGIQFTKECIAMQFTGLKDKNGVEIYEGDIVIEESYPMYDCGLCNYRCVVVWNEEEAGFGLEMYVVSNRVRGCAGPDSISEYTELEVIGNIHDNPEMLEL